MNIQPSVIEGYCIKYWEQVAEAHSNIPPGFLYGFAQPEK